MWNDAVLIRSAICLQEFHGFLFFIYTRVQKAQGCRFRNQVGQIGSPSLNVLKFTSILNSPVYVPFADDANMTPLDSNLDIPSKLKRQLQFKRINQLYWNCRRIKTLKWEINALKIQFSVLVCNINKRLSARSLNKSISNNSELVYYHICQVFT